MTPPTGTSRANGLLRSHPQIQAEPEAGIAATRPNTSVRRTDAPHAAESPLRVFSATTIAPSAHATAPARESTTARQIYWHAGFLLALAFASLFDESVYRAMAWFFYGERHVHGEVWQLILSMAMYGQFLGILTSVGLIWFLDRQHRGRVVTLAIVLCAVGLVGAVLKAGIGRERPQRADGMTIVHGPSGGLYNLAGNDAFPSGHTATAFALSLVLSRFYPTLGPIVWPLAIGVGLNRLMVLKHFPTDVIAGAWLGVSLALCIVAIPAVYRLADRASEQWAPRPRFD